MAWQDDRLVGVEAVVDKDLASTTLATDVRAHKLIIVSSVDRVALDFGRPTQRWLNCITLDEARRYSAAGQFPPGSMGPKIQAAIDFLELRGEQCIITSVESVADAVIGKAGTHIVAPWRRTSIDFGEVGEGAA